MTGNDAQGLPAKKRRRVMEQPDGFQKPKPVDAPKAKIQAPKFASAFDGTVDDAHAKPVYKSKLDYRPAFASEPVSKVSSNKPMSKTNLKHLPVPSFLLPSKEIDKKSAPVLRVLSPPDARIAAKGDSSSTTTTPRLQLRPPPAPNAQTSKPPSKPVAPLNALRALNILTPAEATLDPSLRTISTTDIALATDLFTDSGAAELAHIFLRDQHPEIAASNREEPLEWSIGMSPQKGTKFVKGRGKEAKYVKGGLAARASELMSRSHTSLALWHKETEHKLTSSSFSSRRLDPDLRLAIVHIIDLPAGAKSTSPRKPSHSVSSAVSQGVAFCRVVSAASANYPHIVHGLPRKQEQQHHLVVLSFPTTAPPRLRGAKGVYVRNPEDFVVGREICVWEPWLEVCLTSQSSLVVKVDPALKELTAAPFPTLPPTLPRLSSSPACFEDSDIRTADTALLCSRFVIIPQLL